MLSRTRVIPCLACRQLTQDGLALPTYRMLSERHNTTSGILADANHVYVLYASLFNAYRPERFEPGIDFMQLARS